MNNVVKNSKMSPKKSVTAKQLAKSNLTKRKNPDWDNLDRGYRYLTLDMKLPHDLAVAVMGNVVEESLGDYKAALKNGGGRGLIQWDGRKAPSGRYSLWGSIWASVAKPANVYDSTTDTVKNYWAPWGGLKGDKVRLKFIKAPIKEKARIYAESYLRPGKPRIADRQLSTMQLDSIYNPRIKDVIVLKDGGQIRKMLTAAGGPLNLSPEDIKKGANLIGEYFLKGLGAFGKIMTAPFRSQGPTSATIYKSKELLAKERTIENKSEELLGKAMTWASPLNYGAALATGNGLNARKGEEVVSSWSPAGQALGRAAELYVGPKAIKGVKAAPKTVVNTAAKAGVKPAKAAVVAREIKLATKNKPNLSNRTYTEDKGYYTLFNVFGEDIGKLLTTKPLTSEMKGKGISMISSKNKGRGVSEDLYNVAVLDSKNLGYPGLESGHDLFRPKLTMHVTNKFPKVETPNVSLQNINGKWLYAPDPNKPPIRLLTGTSGKPLPNFIQELTNHRIDLESLKNLLSIKFNEITGDFEEVPIKENIQEPPTSLKFFERKPSKISEAERAGVPKGERFKNKKHYTGIGRNYRGTLFGEENIPKDIEYVEPITSEKKFGENDYSFENRKYATKQYLKELNNRDSGIFSDKGVESIKEYISLLSDDINPNFINTNGLLSFYIRDFRLYLNDLGYKAGDLTDTEIAKLLTDLYNNLSKNLTGKLKGKVVFHSGPNFFDLFDFAHTGETMGNMGYLGPGNYFSTKPSVYGGKGNYTTQDLIGQYRYPRRLPYLINNIKSTPVSGELKRAKIIPEYTSPPRETYGDGTAKNNYILLVILPLVKSTKVRDMAVLDDISVSPHSLYTNGVQTEFMVPRNTGIKSLYPHPSLFIKDANGKIILNRNWDDIRVNYKQGGKMNLIDFLKNGSGIHIKEENKGKFTSYCGGKVTDECILKGKNSSNPAIRKRATFAANARKWKHEDGGTVHNGIKKHLEGGLMELLPIYGTIKSGQRFFKNPSWGKAAEFGLSAVGDALMFTGIGAGAGAAIKAGKFAAKAGKVAKTAGAFDKINAARTLKYMRPINGYYDEATKVSSNLALDALANGSNYEKAASSGSKIIRKAIDADGAVNQLNTAKNTFETGIGLGSGAHYSAYNYNKKKFGGLLIKKHLEGAKLTFGLKLGNLANSDLGKSFISNGLSFLSDKLSDKLFNKSASSNLEIALAAQEKELPTIDPMQIDQMIEIARNQYADPDNPNANGGDIFNSYIKRQITAPIWARQLEEHKKRLAAIDLLTNQAKSSAVGTFFNTLAQGGIEYLLNKYGKTEKADS